MNPNPAKKLKRYIVSYAVANGAKEQQASVMACSLIQAVNWVAKGGYHPHTFYLVTGCEEVSW